MTITKVQKRIFFAVLLGLLATAYFKRDQIKKLLAPGHQGKGEADKGGFTLFSNLKDESKVLEEGSRGKEVEELQKLLNDKNEAEQQPLVPLDVDGIFGPLTAEMLERFTGQKTASLKELKKLLK